jgi:hypothetical protein
LWTNDSSSSRNERIQQSDVISDIPTLAATKSIFLKRVEVTINGTPIDMIEDKQTEDECIHEIMNIYINVSILVTEIDQIKREEKDK